ncbi:hypothetical protein [Aliihoeflea sp. 40Bstr573]|uniref:hypothetical protein n=1 Tax=Aliihoeflea sp. 40Bstr573 TaxID=2696467 RepID=UPI00209569B5|nr:hypothetical protein [Aliihoeflea sp. 40Bstr573]MCO6389053.1 hypothetical protein [Aliihoeflea sp. 40Bstr573]
MFERLERLDAEIRAIESDLGPLVDERERVKGWIRQLGLKRTGPAEAPGAQAGGIPSVEQSSPATIKDMVMAVLADAPNGRTPSEMRKEIKRRFGREIAQKSHSPQLMRLKKEGRIEKAGEVWVLKNENAGM